LNLETLRDETFHWAFFWRQTDAATLFISSSACPSLALFSYARQLLLRKSKELAAEGWKSENEPTE
jgi:hypothetical protein